MEKLNYFKHLYEVPVKTGNFTVNGVGVREPMQPGIINRPGGTGDSLLMFFYDDVVVNSENDILAVPAGTLIYWEKCGHYYGNTGIDWRHSWIHFDGNEATEILHRTGMLPFQLLTPPALMLEDLLTDIDHEMSRVEPDMLIARDRFEIFIREIFRAGICSEKRISVPERMLAVRQYINANYRKNLPLDKTARRFSISRPHLSAEFKRWFGISPGEYQLEKRLREAEILLADHNLQISQVAERVGWDDVCHFTKIFKKHRGQPPSSIRKTKTG